MREIDINIACFMDDSTLATTSAAADAVLKIAIAKMEEQGFVINKSKSAVICIDDDIQLERDADDATTIPIVLSSEPFKMLGVNLTPTTTTS